MQDSQVFANANAMPSLGNNGGCRIELPTARRGFRRALTPRTSEQKRSFSLRDRADLPQVSGRTHGQLAIPPVASNSSRASRTGRDVVNTQNLHALQAQAIAPRRPCQPCDLLVCPPITLAMKPLRECPTNSGQPKSWNRQLADNSVRLCVWVLPKPIPGSRQIFDGAIPKVISASRAAAEIIVNLADHVLVSRRVLHRPRRSLHVHHANARAALAGDVHHLRIAGQPGHVVDDFRAGFHGRPGDLRFGRINRNGHVP